MCAHKITPEPYTGSGVIVHVPVLPHSGYRIRVWSSAPSSSPVPVPLKL